MPLCLTQVSIMSCLSAIILPKLCIVFGSALSWELFSFTVFDLRQWSEELEQITPESETVKGSLRPLFTYLLKSQSTDSSELISCTLYLANESVSKQHRDKNTHQWFQHLLGIWVNLNDIHIKCRDLEHTHTPMQLVQHTTMLEDALKREPFF